MKPTKNNTTRHSDPAIRDSESSTVSQKIGRPSPKGNPLGLNKFRVTNFTGFTLVELIVVITILTILGTIAFTQLGGFAGSARDSARISNLTNLKKGLDLFQIKSGTYPMPESSVAITASGTIIGYQGFAKEQVEGIAKLSPGATQDPSDATIYTTYTVNQNQTKMQAMVFLEESSTLTAFVPNTSSLGITQASASTTSDYSKRYPTTQGDPLGILLSSTGITLNQPVQETGTGIDIIASTGGLYKAYVTSTNIISGTGTIFIPLLTNYDSTIGTFPGCDTKDIKLPNGQVWAACNVGATTVSASYVAGANDNALTEPESQRGKYFQWGENTAWDYNGGVASTDNCVWNRDTQSCGASALGAWVASVSDVTSGGGDRWNDWSTTDTRGPCATNYHVPTQSEWNTVYVDLGSTRNALASTLKLPMAGNRHYSVGSLNYQGSYGFYWSSSPSTTYGYYLYFDSASVNPAYNNFRAYGFSVRCLKN